MIIHTLVFSFDPAMTGQDRKQFFDELGQVVEESGLAKGFEYRDHIAFPPMDEHAPVFVASALAHITLPDLDAVGTLGSTRSLQEFMEHWQARFPYKVVWVNTESKQYDTTGA